MVFSSLTFLFLFLPFVFLVYFSAPRKWKNALLFILSLLFYAWGEPIYILLLIFSTIVDFFLGLYIDKHRSTYKAKIGLITSLVINILVLSVFKYSSFIVQNINDIFGTTFIDPDLPLPIGISFYTFQTMSYIIDVYRGNVNVQRNIINFGAFVSMFPQLVAGPIVRYATIEKQLRERVHSVDLFAEGVQRFTIGLAKKVLIANNIGYIWAEIEATSGNEMSVALAWLGIIAFAFQIYFDFSGYSDMAIGLGLMLGFRFLENFNYPYISRSITEFWRRWHISLGSWFREYVYIPLGGNKKGLPRQLINLLIVWSLTGIWHGASWNFLLWGLYFGALLTVEKLFLLKWLERSRLLSHCYVIFAVLIGWVLFAFDNLHEGLAYMGYLFGFADIPFINTAFMYFISTNWLLLIIVVIASTPVVPYVKEKWQSHEKLKQGLTLVVIFALFIGAVAYLVDSAYNPFLYFRF